MDIYKEVGERILQLKVEHDLTYDELALQSGVSIDHIKAIIAGRRRPRLEMIKKLADALHIPPAALFPLNWLILPGDPSDNEEQFYLSPQTDVEELVRILDQRGWIVRDK